MFTVKHVQHGIENLYPNVKNVTYTDAPSLAGQPGVHLVLQDGSRESFHGKKQDDKSGCSSEIQIYIMNDSGKTVSQYRLAPSYTGFVQHRSASQESNANNSDTDFMSAGPLGPF